jgi:sugar lactone lactonase YvrE
MQTDDSPMEMENDRMMRTRVDLQILTDGLQVPESPRWHEDRLWFSDIMGEKVATLDSHGAVSIVHHMSDRPSGLGWDAEGNLLVVSQFRCKLLRDVGGKLVEFCDLLPLFRPNGAPDSLRPNDLVTDREGRAYVGSMTMTGSGVTPLVMVDGDGSGRILVDDLLSPNGMAISPDGSMLVVAETMAKRLVAFTIGNSGALTERRVFAELDARPDGICFDADGFVWAACPSSGSLVHAAEGGEIEQILFLGDWSPLRACWAAPTVARYSSQQSRVDGRQSLTTSSTVPAQPAPAVTDLFGLRFRMEACRRTCRRAA